jgi:hypothetical protein
MGAERLMMYRMRFSVATGIRRERWVPFMPFGALLVGIGHPVQEQNFSI